MLLFSETIFCNVKFMFILCTSEFFLSFLSPAGWLERLVPKTTCYVLSGTLNSTHLLANFEIFLTTAEDLQKGDFQILYAKCVCYEVGAHLL